MLKVLIPKSGYGKVSGIFFFLFSVSFLVFLSFTVSGQTGGNNLFDNPWLAVPIILGLISLTVSFLTGLLALVKFKDKSQIVLAAIIIGSLLAIILALEFVFPH
jgi:hypothetical protein